MQLGNIDRIFFILLPGLTMANFFFIGSRAVVYDYS